MDINTLQKLPRWVCALDQQGPLESLKVWRSLRQEMIGGNDLAKAEKKWRELEKTKGELCRRLEKQADYDVNKRLLFEKKDGEYRFMHKGENFIKLSKELKHPDLDCPV